MVENVLRANASALPAFTGIDLGEQGYTLARIEKIIPRGETEGESAKQMRQQYDAAWNAAEALAYYDALKQRFWRPHPGRRRGQSRCGDAVIIRRFSWWL